MPPLSYHLINTGYLSMNKYWGETERVRQGTATCTLLTVGDVRLLVDPSPHPEPLAALLYNHIGLRPAAIDLVFVTHWHGDHRYGIELFRHCPWLMAAPALAEWAQAAPEDAPLIDRFATAAGRLPAGVTAVPLPGHTLGLHGLRGETAAGSLMIAGDAVMTREFYAADDGLWNTVDYGLVARTIQMLKRELRLVIPGHDGVIVNF